MSKKKRTRLNDQPIEGFADLEDELPAAGGSASPARAPETAPQASAPHPSVPEHQAPDRPALEHATPSRRPASSRSAPILPWGTVYAASVIVAGVGLGSAALLAGRGGAATWSPADLFSPAKYAAPLDHPVNFVALLAVLVGVVAAFGARALGATMRRLEAERATAERVVDKLTALRLDNEGPWSDAQLRDHPAAGTFVAEVLGAWRLQGARLRRVNGVEGELHRLQKALAENSRDVLTGRFDSPAVGALADELVRFLDARNADAKELAELRRRNDDESAAVMGLIQEARAWNRATLEQIGTQGAALERMSRRLEDLGAAFSGSPAGNGQASALLAEIRRELDHPAQARAPQRTPGLDDLAAQGSKLAFQIAMEVARLGGRGERLQPMSQALEELTTSLRTALDGAGAGNEAPTANLGAVLGKLDTLSRQLGQPGAAAPTPEALEEIARSGPMVGRVAANLADVGRRFQAQSERLLKLGESFSALSGTPFEASLPAAGATEAAAEGSLRVIPQDPFCRDTAAGRVEVDPFAIDTPLVAPAPRPVLAPEPVASAPAMAMPVASTPVAPVPAMPAPAVPAPVAAAPAAPAPVAPTPVFTPAAEDDGFVIERSAPGLTVFDHSAIDIAPLELDTMVPGRVEEPEAPRAPSPPSPLDERIYDLAEFGAVRIEDDLERVHELSEFGAVRVA